MSICGPKSSQVEQGVVKKRKKRNDYGMVLKGEHFGKVEIKKKDAGRKKNFKKNQSRKDGIKTKGQLEKSLN